MSQLPYPARRVAVAVAATLSMGYTTTVAAEQTVWPTYEIVNLDEMFSVRGTLENTRNGYGAAVSGDTAIAISKGINDATAGEGDDDDNIIDDVVDAILPESGVTANSIRREFVGNNFLFEHDVANGFEPLYVGLLEDKPPVLNPEPEDDDVPRTNAFYFGASDNFFGSLVRIGSTSALQQQEANPNFNPTPDDEDDIDEDENYDDDEFFFFREFENRGFVQTVTPTGNGVVLLPPSLTSFSPDEESTVQDPVTIGGISVASGVNDNGSVVGYATTELSEIAIERLQSCYDQFDPPEDDEEESELEPVPLDTCIQSLQNNAQLSYQSRAYRWELDSGTEMTVNTDMSRALPLGFTPDEDDSNIYTTQALAVNNAGYVVGRGNRVRNDDNDLINSGLWAMFWTPQDEVRYVGPTFLDTERVGQSILYDVNDNGIAIGVVQRFISGYTRYKFGVVDLNEEGEELTFFEPNDFFDDQSDLSSRARAINNNGLVVGNIEVDRVRNLPRRVRAFLYDQPNDNFVNLNELLTCRSRGYEESLDENNEPVYTKYIVRDTESFSTPVEYEADIILVDANHIAEDGTIVGTALVELPRLKTELVDVTDEDGNVIGQTSRIVLENGKPVVELTAGGDPSTDQVPRSVVLKTTSATEMCPLPLDDGLNVPPNERQGAGFGWAWLLGLAPLAWIRRKLHA
ncbi:DUF3466 family protein [Ferrimonas marina]|uniref:DUF3466 family protein n=1 Tax=Ferrimonas marina TaxID=299255 RepID=A0A1M5NEW3_9GAMM|nr:DUF3466 family protein [Ferrimonas marina]SHG88146.1 Protein of unknown function [Ferrimonas marina]